MINRYGPTLLVWQSSSSLTRLPIQRNPSRIPGADGMRAFACLLVLAHHLCQQPVSQIPGFLKVFLQTYGPLGVGIFFVLSGMLLSVPFWNAYFSASDLPALSAYAARRFARIVPAYYVCLIILFLVEAFVQFDVSPGDWARLLSGLTFTNSFHWRTFFPSDLSPPCWSIGIEMVFYVLLPIWAAGLFLVRQPTWPVAYVGAWMLGLAVLQWTLVKSWPSCEVSPGENVTGLQRVAASWLPAYNPLGLFTHFLLGCAAGGLVAKPTKLMHKVPSSRNRRLYAVNRYDWLSLVLCLMLLADLIENYLHGASSLDALSRLLQYRTVWFIPFRWPLFPLLIAAMLVALCKSSSIGRYADNRFCTLTATLSFGIYLWHYPVMFAMRKYWTNLEETDAVEQITFVMSVVLVTYMVAGLSYLTVERPLLRFVHRLTSPKLAVR